MFKICITEKSLVFVLSYSHNVGWLLEALEFNYSGAFFICQSFIHHL